MTDEIARGVDDVFSGIERIINAGKYREKQEAAEVLASMDYFRNFGYEDIEFKYAELRERLESDLAEGDLPAVWTEEL